MATCTARTGITTIEGCGRIRPPDHSTRDESS